MEVYSANADGRIIPLMRKVWSDLKDWWKSQLFVGIVVAFIPLTYQWFVGMLTMDQLRNDAWLLLWPYTVILAAFLLGNVGRTIILHDRDRLRIKRKLE